MRRRNEDSVIGRVATLPEADVAEPYVANPTKATATTPETLCQRARRAVDEAEARAGK